MPIYRPWHLRNLAALEQYTAILPEETREWVLALFVDKELGLLSVETIACGSIMEVEVNVFRLISRGRRLRAAGYFLVHNHPSGNPTPSEKGMNLTRRLMSLSEDCDLPLLAHVIVAEKGMKAVWRVVRDRTERRPRRASTLTRAKSRVQRSIARRNLVELTSQPNSARYG